MRSEWRINTPLRALRRNGWEVREVALDRPGDLPDGDVLVLHQPTGDAMLTLVEEARRRGVAVVVDSDDLLFTEALPVRAALTRRWHPLAHRWEAEARAAAGLANRQAVAEAPPNPMVEQFHRCLRLADAVTVATAPLAAAYARLNPEISVLPNCYDDANPLWDAPPAGRAGVAIGFAGSEHHVDNLPVLRGALAPVLRAHADVRLVEAGEAALLTTVDARAEQLVDLGTLPFDAFPLLLHEMDVVLAPLSDEPFMACKSNIRCLTAGLVGAPVVASPVGPYLDYVEHGCNGFLARGAEEWTAYLERLVTDAPLRRSMGEANRARARAYAISAHIGRWSEVYERVLRRRRRA